MVTFTGISRPPCTSGEGLCFSSTTLTDINFELHELVEISQACLFLLVNDVA